MAQILEFPSMENNPKVPKVTDKSPIKNHVQKQHVKVFVVGPDSGVVKMFLNRGYIVTQDENEPGIDLVCFTGGADVSPIYYQQSSLPKTYTNPKRDEEEIIIYRKFLDVPKVGICRGGQLLNVLSGGRMYQDVDGHGGDHTIFDLFLYKRPLVMTSTHHQMMIPGINGHVLAIADRSTFKKSALRKEVQLPYDVEVVYYEKTKSLCFQPHPEYVDNDHDCNVYFFELVNTLL